MRIRVAWLRGVSVESVLSESVIVQGLFLSLSEAVAVAPEDASGADVIGSFGDDLACVAGEAFVSLLVEGVGEAEEVLHEEL